MKTAFLLVPFLLFARVAPGQDSLPLTLSFSPSAQMPVGPLRADGTQYYGLGAGADLEGDLGLPGLPFLSARLGLGFLGLPIRDTSKQLSIATLGLGPRLLLSPTPRLGLELAAGGGYALLIGPTITVGNPFAQATLRASYNFGPAFSLALGAAYRLHFNATGLDYQGIGLTLGAGLGLNRGTVKSRMQILDPRFDPVFPVFYKYYEDNSFGMIRVRNGEAGKITNLRVSFIVPQFMVGAKECAALPELGPGAERDIPIRALFADAIIGLTEDTKVEAKVIYSYNYLDSEREGESALSLRIYNRNAMTWEDDRRPAAFVSSKDPAVLSFAKTAAGIARETSLAVNNPFRQSMGIFQALGAYGLRYVPDPSSPFTDLTKSKGSVDYLQFPAQTLAYKAGDCDDLSILYAALLEGTGVGAAFLTIPGHIYLAFDLGMDATEAKSAFSQPQDLIFREGRAWLPVEVTLVREGFLAAWRTGAREWREADAKGQAGFSRVEEAWRTYEAAAFIGSESAFKPPSVEAESAAFAAEMARFIDAEVKAREPPILKEIAATQGKDARSLNRLGVLYARYALYDKAVEQFNKAALLVYGPSMVNLGNIALQKADSKRARVWFEKAIARDPTSVPALVGLTRSCQATEDGASAASWFQKLKSLDPRTAERYAYLVAGEAGGARASQAVDADLLWSESE